MGLLDGLKAVVTGSGGKMGGGIALKLAEAGADIVLNDRVPDQTEPFERDIKKMGVDVVSVLTNVTRREGAEAVIAAAIERWGRVDILVNVVGGIRGPLINPIWEVSEEDWEFGIGLNLRATFHCTQVALPGMMERRAGKIVNIASTAWAGGETNTQYATAKAGVVAFTRSVATQLGPYNINVNAVAPGGTIPERPESIPKRSSMADRDDPEAWKGRVPLGRPNYPGHIGDAAVFLCSEEARNISGQLLIVAGGQNPWL